MPGDGAAGNNHTSFILPADNPYIALQQYVGDAVRDDRCSAEENNSPHTPSLWANGRLWLMVRIFIVDDEPILHRLYKDVFAIKGYEVVDDAYDGQEAVEKFANMYPRPDVVILDHRMPNKDGIEAMGEMLEIDPNARIVFISADANVRDEALKMGAVGFGLKPVTIRHMLELVESAARGGG